MRTLAIIGAVLVLLVPFAYTSVTTETILGDFEVTSSLGLLRYSTSAGDYSETFSGNWIEEGDMYDFYFGDLYLLGLVILLLLIASIGIGFTQPEGNLAAILLIVAASLLLLLRFLRLNDADSFFYHNETVLGAEITYWEIPIGFILGLAFGLADMRKK